MEKLIKQKIEIPMNDNKTQTIEKWNIEDIANKINEIIEALNEITKK